jgi:opacity protein-like surface antigen
VVLDRSLFRGTCRRRLRNIAGLRSGGPDIFGGNVRTPAAVGGGQIGFNWQIPNSLFVLGAEADASALGADGTATCLASSGFVISANCHMHQQAACVWSYERL